MLIFFLLASKLVYETYTNKILQKLHDAGSS